MKGEQVLGVDINQKTVDCVNEGLEPFPEEENLKAFLAEVVSAGKLKASTSTSECVSKSDVVVVVVPLFVDINANPDFSALDSATAEIARGLKKGTLIAYETTLPIGTTRTRFTKRIEEISGFKVGQDFYVVFSPERVLTGRIFSDLKKYPKIVGGVTEACTRLGESFYKRVLDFVERKDLEKPNGVWIVDSVESAEFVKLAETTYRDVNIGLANQFAMIADKHSLNIYEVISASNSQTFSHIHHPGIAVGGHCIPIYPQFLLWRDPEATIIRAARQVNSGMPNYALSLIQENVTSTESKNLLILGISYRAGVKEHAFSGVFPLVNEAKKIFRNVYVYDPMYSEEDILGFGLNPFPGDYSEVHVVVIQTENPDFIPFLNQTLDNCELILDGRNLLSDTEPAPNRKLMTIGNVDLR
jgi:nucleotide sugar dehydrogenase